LLLGEAQARDQLALIPRVARLIPMSLLEHGRPVGNLSQLARAAQTRHDEKDILEDHPAGVLQPPPLAGDSPAARIFGHNRFGSVLVASQWRWWSTPAGWSSRISFSSVVSARQRASCDRLPTDGRAREGFIAIRARHAVELGELVTACASPSSKPKRQPSRRVNFVANMSHELRTPLNAITLYAEMLEEDAGAEGREAAVPTSRRFRQPASTCSGLINGLLDLSKIEAGRMELDLQSFRCPRRPSRT